MGQDNGAPLSGRAAGLRPQPATQSSQSSIPSAGELGIIEHRLVKERHSLARVVKARSSGMWEVEVWETGWNTPGQWSSPHRRKVAEWIPIPGDIDPEIVAPAIREMGEAFYREERKRRKNYHRGIREYAQAMSASGQDPQGLKAKPASAVGNADAPEPPSHSTQGDSNV